MQLHQKRFLRRYTELVNKGFITVTSHRLAQTMISYSDVDPSYPPKTARRVWGNRVGLADQPQRGTTALNSRASATQYLSAETENL